MRATVEVRGEVDLTSCAPRCEIRARRTMSLGLDVSDKYVASRSERHERIETSVTKSNRTAGGEVAEGIYEK
jgi:hypothetical protein